ncbi:nucleotidyl transferase AbiEii/AbiGii toxin family protein [Methylomonas sp. AM2-LC]|uniref:nucleotidyl transferase AbiEii/AbiGii toxin family protein n=1 Tax=Methylomonas sp. AM2-LC TaxID=3153301 RepID=UPI0032646D14
MAETWFELSADVKSEALEYAATKTGRPAHLLEKDIWVVWIISVIYESELAQKLTFKGGTSLSKAYGIIDRFSEDVDLTYDIRELLGNFLTNGNPIPKNTSQQQKISKLVRDNLPIWIETKVKPIIEKALQREGIEAEITQTGNESEKLVLGYQAVKSGNGYSAPTIQLEFGGRATGEPHHVRSVICDISQTIENVIFPKAKPLVMTAERTFWEKATAAHVYCLQGRLRGERYSRHWYDLTALAKSAYFFTACNDAELANMVAEHKTMFFVEKDKHGSKIDYYAATRGQLLLIPQGESLTALERDYENMLKDGLLSINQPSFAEVIDKCQDIQDQVNKHRIS